MKHINSSEVQFKVWWMASKILRKRADVGIRPYEMYGNCVMQMGGRGARPYKVVSTQQLVRYRIYVGDDAHIIPYGGRGNPAPTGW